MPDRGRHNRGKGKGSGGKNPHRPAQRHVVHSPAPGGIGNPSLLFDRYLPQGVFGGGDGKANFLQGVLTTYEGMSDEIGRNLKVALDRREAMVDRLGGRRCAFEATGRLVTGLGATHVLESGFLWHPTLAVPYIEGSSIKGMMRARVDPSKGWEQDETWKSFSAFFGDGDAAGNIDILPALPLEPPPLEVSFITPHGIYDHSKVTPLPYLTVSRGARFESALIPRRGTSVESGALDLAEHLLIRALEDLGIGARTSLNFGRMEPIKDRGA